MENVFTAEKAVKIAAFNNIDVYTISTEKFKTSSINFFFEDDLTRERVTLNALLPAVMRRGSAEHPTFRDIAMELEKLYGASFDCGVTKKGERHILQFYIEFLSQKFVPEAPDIFSAAFELIYGIITKPFLENGHFREDYLAQEKEKLRMLIESRVNDKMQYSVDRCLEEVCRNEPYGIYDYGFTSDLEKITAEDLAKHFIRVLQTYPMKVYLTGSISGKQAERMAVRLREMARSPKTVTGSGFKEKRNIRSRYVDETMNVTQGKLCLGLRTNIAPNSGEFQALMVYNGVLGGGVHSKLFQNVREKASLAYYVYSRLERFKGLMAVSSGIELKNKDKALEIILKQLDEIKKGNISEQEMEATKKSMETDLKSLRDSQMGVVDFYLSQTVAGTDDNFNDVIEKIWKVTPEDVAKAASKTELDTVYFLTAPDAAKKTSQN